MLHLGGIPFLHFESLLNLGTVITSEASMLDPKCNNGFITFRTNGLLHLGPNFITLRTLLHLRPILYYI